MVLSLNLLGAALQFIDEIWICSCKSFGFMQLNIYSYSQKDWSIRNRNTFWLFRLMQEPQNWSHKFFAIQLQI